MPCQAYVDQRLAAVYDTLNPPEAHYAYYVDLAGSTPVRVLDMGCGTGRLAVALAARGHQATGADPAAAMLEIARRRSGGEAVSWVESAAQTLDLATRFDLIIMTGHVFQVFLDDRSVLAALENLGRHLAPGGRIAFETRNPLVREWEGWIPDETRESLDVPEAGRVCVHYDIAGIEGDLVTFETHFVFGAGDVAVATTTLRFIDRATLERLLSETGLAALSWFGDWDRSPATDSSPEIIVTARLAPAGD